MALEIDESEENVAVTANYLMSKGILISSSSSEYELTTCSEMAGYETDSARRMRLLRNRQNEQSGALPSHCDSDVTTSDNDVQKGDIEKEIRDKELRDKELRDKKTNQIPADKPREVDFEKFWSAYPKKVGKSSAKKAFSRVKEPVETLLTAIERQKCSIQWSKEDGQYIPNPATWLNQSRWEDELATAGSPNPYPEELELVDDGNGGLIWRMKD